LALITEARLPKARLSERLATLERDLRSNQLTALPATGTPDPVPILGAAMDDARGTMTRLAPRLDRPWQPDSVINADYLREVQTLSTRISLYDIIIQEGIRVVLKSESGLAFTPDGSKAVGALDRLASATRSAEEAHGQIVTILDEYHRVALAKSMAAPPLAIIAAPTVRQLEIRSDAISAAASVLVALVTAAVGFVVLILSNPGFGTQIDYFKALFWGAGLQVAGQQLQLLSPSSVRAAVSIQLPR
jgi:hypothetical protein